MGDLLVLNPIYSAALLSPGSGKGSVGKMWWMTWWSQPTVVRREWLSGDQVASLTKSLWARLLNLQEKKEKCGHVRETGGTKKRTRHPRARPVDVLQSNPGPDFHRRNESQSKGNDTSQHQTADHSKAGSAIPISAWCLSPYSTLHCLRVALHMRRVDCPFLGDSWKARLGNPTPHHLPPLPGTELVVSQPRTRERVEPASITRSRG